MKPTEFNCGMDSNCNKVLDRIYRIDRAIKYVSNAEKIENNQSLRKLARLGFELYIAKNYQNGEITLREASELLTLTPSETLDLLSKMGVTGNIRSSDVLDSLNTVAPLD